MVSPVNGSDLAGLGLGVPQAVRDEELGQNEFLQLMTTQLKNQDPLKPMESGEFPGSWRSSAREGLADCRRRSIAVDIARLEPSVAGRGPVGRWRSRKPRPS
jgi:hypothetical protein